MVLHSFCMYLITIDSVNTDKINKMSHKGGTKEIKLVNGYRLSVDVDHAFLTSISAPEPATMLLLDSGLLAMAVFGRKNIFK
jgi:hypothetical protein